MKYKCEETKNEEGHIGNGRDAGAVGDIANGMVQLMKEAFHVDLDYSLESLANVEKLLSKLKRSGGGDGVAFGFGCYVGETLVRNGHGRWVHDEEFAEQMGSAWVLQLPGHVFASPMQRCAKFMKNGTKDGVEVWTKAVIAMSGNSSLAGNEVC
jgi:hypothetical protein